MNELSSDAPAVAKIEEEEKSEDEGTPSGISAMAMPTSLYHTNTGQYRMFANVLCDDVQHSFVPRSYIMH